MCIAHGAHGQPQISILSFLSQIFHLWKSQHTFYKYPMTWKKQKYLMARKKEKEKGKQMRCSELQWWNFQHHKENIDKINI